MNSCIKRLHQDMNPGQVVIIKLPEDYELTIKKADKLTCTGKLLVIHREKGRKTVVNTDNIIYAYIKEETLWAKTL